MTDLVGHERIRDSSGVVPQRHRNAGQDGACLAEYLLGLGYTVHGVKRRSSSFNTARVDHLYEDPHAGNVPFLLHYGDMTDSTNLIRLMQQIRPLLSPAEIREAMQESATPFTTVTSPEAVGAGLLEAEGALAALEGTPVVDPPSVVVPALEGEEEVGPEQKVIPPPDAFWISAKRSERAKKAAM